MIIDGSKKIDELQGLRQNLQYDIQLMEELLSRLKKRHNLLAEHTQDLPDLQYILPLTEETINKVGISLPNLYEAQGKLSEMIIKFQRCLDALTSPKL